MNKLSKTILTTNESNAIRYIRVLSVILIVSCHILQGLDSPLAHILNIGVQIFFFTSGFLYGNKTIYNQFDWYKSRFKRIYLPYIIFLIPTLLLIWVFSYNHISFWSFGPYLLNLQGFVPDKFKISGLGHLWFLTVLQFCYFITPLLSKRKNKALLVYLLIVSIICMLTDYFAYVIWILVYISGFLVGRYKKFPILLSSILTIASVILYLITPYNTSFNILFHGFGGASIFMVLYRFIPRIILEKRCKAIEAIENISYEIYLSHLIFIFGAFSLMDLTTSIEVNILAILCSTLATSYLIKIGTSHFNNRFMNVVKIK